MDVKKISNYLDGDYTIPVCRDEILTRAAGTDLTLPLHVQFEFCTGKVGQFSTWYLFRFSWIFYQFFFVSMPVYEIENL